MVVSFTGHREFEPKKVGDRLAREIEELLPRAEGRVTFWTGMAMGFDLAAAEVVLSLRDNGADVVLNCALPHPSQVTEMANEVERERYQYILAHADRVETLSTHYSPWVYHERNDFLVDQADVIVAYYDETRRKSGTGYTVRRALRRGLEVRNIYPQQQLQLDLV